MPTCRTCQYDHPVEARCPADPLLGQTLDGRYRLDGVIGRGGMGAVYLATHLQVDRPVAIKVLHVDRQRDDAAERRFAREAKMLARLQHPHVLALHDAGATPAGLQYFVTEVLHGVPLSTAIAAGAFDSLRIARVLRQTAEGLAAAHVEGIVHRDLKPDNLFLEWAGGRDHVKILDFGIAWFVEASVQTAPGEVFGTPSFMAPEQAQGAPVDHRTDLYSLGVVGWSCATGKPPFEGKTPLAVLMQHISKPPPPLDRGVVDAELAALIEQMLAKDPAHRPADAAEVAERAAAIEARLGGDAAPSRPPADADATVMEGDLAPVRVDPAFDPEPTLAPDALGGSVGLSRTLSLGAAPEARPSATLPLVIGLALLAAAGFALVWWWVA